PTSKRKPDRSSSTGWSHPRDRLRLRATRSTVNNCSSRTQTSKRSLASTLLQGVADLAQQLDVFGIRRRFRRRRRGGLVAPQSTDRLDRDEYREGDDEKVDRGVDELAIADHRGPGG